MTLQKYEVLYQLLASYFHQDWVVEFDNEEEGLQAIIDSEPKEKLIAGPKEIDALLSKGLSDQELNQFLSNELECHFNPASLGLSTEFWLKQVRAKFTVH
jgi:CdiI immunity protein